LTAEASSNLAQLLTDLLGNTSDTFLKNTITAALRWCYRDNLFADVDRASIASTVTQVLVYNDSQKALQQPASAALRCAQSAGNYLELLVAKYVEEISELEQPPDNLPETANALYEVTQKPAALSEILNKKFDSWVSTEKGLALLFQIHLLDEHKVPSGVLLDKIANAMSPEIADSALVLNKLRKQVIYRNWNSTVAPALAARFVGILQQSAADTSYIPRSAFVVQSLIEKPECLEAQFAPLMWPHIQALYTKFGDASTREEIHKAILVFAADSPDTATKQAAKALALQNWQAFTDSQLRGVLGFLLTLQVDQQRQELRSLLVNQEYTLIQNELSSPTDRTRQRLELCYENKLDLPTKGLDEFLIKTLDSQDAAFEVWRFVISDYVPKLGGDFSKRIAETCLSLATGSHTVPRRLAFFDLFATVLPSLDADTKTQLLPQYFVLCKHSDQNIRSSASTILDKMRKSVDEQDFKLGLNPLVREICRMTPAEVENFRPTLDAALQHSALFGDYEWRDLADLAKRGISQADPPIQDYSLSLVEKMPAIPSDHEDDLIHVLIVMAKGGGQTQRDRADKILRKLTLADLAENAQHALQGYLSPPADQPTETQ
jgi:hypothetical protein